MIRLSSYLVAAVVGWVSIWYAITRGLELFTGKKDV